MTTCPKCGYCPSCGRGGMYQHSYPWWATQTVHSTSARVESNPKILNSKSCQHD